MSPPKWLLPVALAADVGAGFLLWYSMSDFDRARWYAIVAGTPVTVFAILSLIGISGQK